ncbi:unnamed protein product [Pedinophyceae sp. YPF-701]|nr:unnamed protein product [Pedinophyceae sp. YPF-701]
MGVPAFYRWLSEKYPKIIKNVIEEQGVPLPDGGEAPVDWSGPNPNGEEFDNLYLDMNGIIHPCFHPEDRPAPTTEAEVFQNIFEYIDRLVAMVRPRQVLYMAIAGVAPRAKMNQQRSRRFRAAQDNEERAKQEARIRAELEAEGVRLPPAQDGGGEVFDSNTITPGTPFMGRLSAALQYYVHVRLNHQPAWRDLMVVLSDSNVPGEGEHKAVGFIREQRGRPGWNPCTRHVVYGLDADLIMLALATHEPHFFILRELVTLPMKKDARQEVLDRAKAAVGEAERAEEPVSKKPYQMVKIAVLREYLALDLAPLDRAADVPGGFDPERCLDDFVFMCFFAGNDFLPHMPTLEIREGAIELLMHVYRREVARTGHLTDGSHVHLDRVQHFIRCVGAYEDLIFSKRARMLMRDKRRRAEQRAAGRMDRVRGAGEMPKWMNGAVNQPPGAGPRGAPRGPSMMVAAEMARMDGAGRAPGDEKRPWGEGAAGPQSNQGAAAALRDKIMAGMKRKQPEADAAVKAEGDAAPDRKAAKLESSDAPGAGHRGEDEKPSDPAAFWSEMGGVEGAGVKEEPEDAGAEEADVVEEEEEEEEETDAVEEEEVPAELLRANNDKLKEKLSSFMKDSSDKFDEMLESEGRVRLGEPGWKERYYAEKFGVEGPALRDKAREVARAFVEGLVWVMRYYYDGVASWTWYYPYHYAPFASDLGERISELDIQFQPGKPFKPFNQLMGVLPAASQHCLPEPFRWLFDSKESPILDFYPTKFTVDMNGKRFAWQGVALLPFIDEKRLLAATEPLEGRLSDEERWRNGQRLALLFVHRAFPLAKTALGLEERVKTLPEDERRSAKAAIDPRTANKTNGTIYACQGEAMPARIKAPFGLGDDVENNQVVCMVYDDPPHQRHEPRVHPDTIMPPTELTELDMPEAVVLWDPRRR